MIKDVNMKNVLTSNEVMLAGYIKALKYFNGFSNKELFKLLNKHSYLQIEDIITALKKNKEIRHLNKKLKFINSIYDSQYKKFKLILNDNYEPINNLIIKSVQKIHNRKGIGIFLHILTTIYNKNLSSTSRLLGKNKNYISTIMYNGSFEIILKCLYKIADLFGLPKKLMKEAVGKARIHHRTWAGGNITGNIKPKNEKKELRRIKQDKQNQHLNKEQKITNDISKDIKKAKTALNKNNYPICYVLNQIMIDKSRILFSHDKVLPKVIILHYKDDLKSVSTAIYNLKEAKLSKLTQPHYKISSNSKLECIKYMSKGDINSFIDGMKHEALVQIRVIHRDIQNMQKELWNNKEPEKQRLTA